MAPVYIVCGVSGSGKSWVCRQLSDKFNYVPHDRCWEHPYAKPAEGLDPKWGPAGCKSTHLETLIKEAKDSKKPVLSEVPFGERGIKEGLETAGVKVVPVFVIEEPQLIADRYFKREGKQLNKAAYSRAFSIKDRAIEWNAKRGTSAEILEHLKNLDLENKEKTEYTWSKRMA